MNKVAVVIPIYKTVPDELEKISLHQCNNILNKYPIVLIAPDKLDCNNYLTILPEAKINYYQSSFFESQKTYNRLMLSLNFYESFNEYDYILIYQPDAFVFKDELNDWCKKGYDYVGAPWFKNFNEQQIILDEPWGVGNGGLSLRKIKSFIDILSVDKPVNNKDEILKKSLNYGIKYAITTFPETILKLSGIKNRSREFIKNFPVNEDYFWGYYASKINKNFKVAPISDAIKFAFECSPAKLYERNNHSLPFGCHAWWKYDLEFWRPFIKKIGYNI